MLDAGDVTRWRQMRQKRDALPWRDDLAIDRKEFAVADRDKADVEKDPATMLDGETHRFMTADVGGDHFWVVIRAWSKGKWSTMLFEGYIAGKGGMEPELEALQKKFGVQNDHVFVDVGFEMESTIELCARHGWIGVKGEGERAFYSYRNPRRPSAPTVERLFSIYKNKRGDKGTMGRYISLATDPIKDVLWRLMNGHGMRFEVLPDASKAYHHHMKSEVRKEVPVGKRKTLKHHWETTNRKNHLWDAEVYQVSAALIKGLFVVDEE